MRPGSQGIARACDEASSKYAGTVVIHTRATCAQCDSERACFKRRTNRGADLDRAGRQAAQIEAHDGWASLGYETL